RPHPSIHLHAEFVLEKADSAVGAPQEHSIHLPGIKPEEPQTALELPHIPSAIPHLVDAVVGTGRPVLGCFTELPLGFRSHLSVHFHPEFILEQANGAVGAISEVSVDLTGIKPQIFQTTLKLVNVSSASILLQG